MTSIKPEEIQISEDAVCMEDLLKAISNKSSSKSIGKLEELNDSNILNSDLWKVNPILKNTFSKENVNQSSKNTFQTNITESTKHIGNNNLNQTSNVSKNKNQSCMININFEENQKKTLSNNFPAYPFPAQQNFSDVIFTQNLYNNYTYQNYYQFINPMINFPSPQNFIYYYPVPLLNNQKQESKKIRKRQENSISSKSSGSFENCNYSNPKVNKQDKNAQCITKRSSEIENLISSKYPLNYISNLKTKKQINNTLNQLTVSEIMILFNKLIPKFHNIMTDSSGNYFCQEFFNYLGKQERIKLWKIIESDVYYYSTHEFANHCLQKLVELASDDQEQVKISKLISKLFDDLIYNNKATHIIQKILLHFNYSNKENLSKKIIQRFPTLVCDSKGICIIKQYMAGLAYESKLLKDSFLLLINENLIFYLCDKYAHYLILHMIEIWSINDFLCIVEEIKLNIIKLSMNTYASRVVEKCIYKYKNVSKT